MNKALVCYVVLFATGLGASAATFTVINTNQSGAGSLRQAIEDANANPDADLIAFNIPPGSGLMISPTNALPAIVQPVSLDGATQPGYAGTPLVEINGASAGIAGVDGLRITTSNCMIRSLAINRFTGDGIEISGPGSNAIIRCYIGMGAEGVTNRPNAFSGVYITNAPNNFIFDNLISGNSQHGVHIGGTNATNNILLVNTIGLDINNADKGNVQDGVRLNAPLNVVGNFDSLGGNVISGNNSDGIEITGATSAGNQVLGNTIGADRAFTLRRGNSADGILVNGAPGNFFSNNLVLANSGDGIEITGAGAAFNVFRGNVVGGRFATLPSFGNGGQGISITSNARSNSIGSEAGEPNVIAFNTGDGVAVQAGTNNAIRANSIHSNGDLGIDHSNNGVSANDAGDSDGGPNQLQNFPVITNAVLHSASTLIEGTLNSRPSATYHLDFFASFVRDAASTNGEGQQYLGSATVSTGTDSNAAFSVTLPAEATAGRWITATATDTNGNTSEFSTAFRAPSTKPPATFTVINTNDTGFGSLRQAILDNNVTFSAGNNLIRFQIPGPGVQIISLVGGSILPAITEPVTLDGYTQPGATPNSLAGGNNAVILIQVERPEGGNAVGDGLRLQAPGCVVRGLSIVRFSVNGDGIEIASADNVIEGNFIGLIPNGTNAVGNSQGIFINGTSGNLIGGTTPAARNVISGNNGNGIGISGAGASNNLVAGNYIGSDAGGTQDFGNGNDGVNINNAVGNFVGNGQAGSGNVISGNNGSGVNITGVGATNNHVLGNRIGTDATGTNALGNNQNGVNVQTSARYNTVGFPATGRGNVIAFNGNAGVVIGSGTNNAVRGNSIFSHPGLAIDLGNNGVTFNDENDVDAGANHLQNYPVLTGGLITPTNTTVQGSLHSRSNTIYFIDFYAGVICDDGGASFGVGEGRQPIGSTTVTTDGNGNATFDVTLPEVAAGRYLTATATDTNGNTSEFSICVRANSAFPPQTFTVVNTNDNGPGSLRQALLDAGGFPSSTAHLIQFNIPGTGPHTISPLSQLPTNAEPVMIDGYTQQGATMNTLSNGFNAAIRIRLDGGSFSGFGGAGVRLMTSGNRLRGIAFTGWGNRNAIEIAGGGSNIVSGCLVGIDTDGSDKHAGQGITLTDSVGNLIGGLSPGERNIISYNFSHGINIVGAGASNNVVQGNFIGTDFTGTLRRGNAIDGIRIDEGSYNLIGGTTPGARNVISGNSSRGVRIAAFTLGTGRGNVIQGNHIGVDVTGSVAIGNSSDGITVQGIDTVVGGAAPGARNIVAGNGQFGIDLASFNGTVLGNWIGVGSSGNALSNVTAGVAISGSSNRVGGIAPGEANIIANNRGWGVYVFSGTGNQIRGNSIYNNQSQFPPTLGIDLGGDGVTANDIGDSDSGQNNRQNFPLITSASGGGASTTIAGTLNSAASQTFELDIFASAVCDASGHGEGQQYLGSTSVSTDGSGNASFNVVLPVAAQGRFITATATDSQGNSSEFSPCFEATLVIPAMTFTVVNTNDSGAGSLRQAILDSNGHITSSNNTIAFNIPGSGVRSIKLLSPLPAFTQPVTIDGFTQPGASANTSSSSNNANWLVEVRGVGAAFNEETLRLGIPNLVVRGLRLSGSAGVGIEIVSSNCVVAGCFIASNGAGGITIVSAHANRIGGTAPADRNVISGHNGSRGIEISGGNANVVLGNFIGPAPDGTSAFGTSQFEGVNIFNGSGNVIGDGTTAGGNVIAFHTSDGVALQSGTNNSVRANRIFSNSFGIDLGSDTATANDLGDGDGGPNQLQNFPVLTNVIANAGSTVIQGRLNSRTDTTFTLDFFANTTCQLLGRGQGEFYLGSAVVVTDGSGNVDFNVSIPLQTPRTSVAATATDPFGNTSEFSPCKEATINLPPQTFVVVTTNDSGPGSLRQAVLDSALVQNVGADRIHFNIPGAGPHSIRLLSDFPILTEPLIFDGYTQPGSSVNTSSNGDNAVLMIEIDGTGLSSPNRILGLNSNSTVRGISFSGNTGTIVFLSGNSNVIEGNWFGVRPSGESGSSAATAIDVGGDRNQIGGTNPAQRNVIGNAVTDGIRIFGDSNVVAGNLIGVGLQGTNPIPNVDNGVRIINNAVWNTIGGLAPGAGNVIWHNQGYGVAVESGRQNAILSNVILSNRLGKIFIAPGVNDGVQPPQVLQAYSGSIVVEGKFQGLPNTTYLVQTHYVLVVPFGGAIDGGVLGETNVTTDASGNASYTQVFAFEPGPFDSVYSTVTCENNTSEDSDLVQVVPGNSADLQLNMQTPTTAALNSTNSYVVTVSNAGPATATGVYLEQGLPPGLEILSVTSTNGTCTVSNGLLVCDLGTLAEGQTAQVVVRTVARTEGIMVTSARVTALAPDIALVNNRVTRDTVVRGSGTPVDVQVSTGVSAQQAQPGTNVNVVSQVRNNTSNPAGGVVFRQAIPKGTQVTGATSTKGTCSITDGAVVCDIGSLAAGEQVTVTVMVTMGAYGPQRVFEFGSTVTTTSSEVNPDNNVARAAVALQLPNVAAGRDGDQPTVWWPASIPGLQLEETFTLEELSDIAAWLGIPDELISQEGANHVYRPWTWMGPQGYYRLRPEDPPTPSIELYQQSISFDSVFVPFSDWGRVDITFVPEAGVIQYFNLSLPCPEGSGAKGGGQQTNECWPVQNLPLVTNGQTNRPTRMSVNFRWGTNGVLITNDIGWSLTTNVLFSPPQTTNFMYVAPLTTRVGTGFKGLPTTWWPATTLTGGGATNVWTAKPSFPNPEQGPNQSAPASVMNSLNYLKNYLGVTNLPRVFINITNMMAATGWEPGGSPQGGFGFDSWVDKKKAFMQQLNIQIQTIETNSIQGAIWALTNCYDVEIWMETHVACIVAIADIGNGDYAITIQHDVNPGVIGGTVREIVIFDSESGNVYGSTWARDFNKFVIERPGPPP